MQEDVTLAENSLKSTRHAEEAGTHRLPKGGLVLFDDVFTFENLYDAGAACCNGVRWKASTQVFETRLASWASSTLDQLRAGEWRSGGFNSFRIVERGKVRDIQSVHISERMVQKCLVRNCLRPLVLPRLISDSHATIPGHGTESALSRLREHLRWHYARHGTEGYVLTMDYHNYFGCIRHDTLVNMYRRLPMDDRLLELTAYLIGCFEGEVGIGLGSEVSQVSAVFYASPIDHTAKDLLGVHCYGRYMDDSYAILPTKQEARDLLSALREKSTELGLEFNERVTGIRPIRNGFRYLKKRVSLTETGRIVMRLQRDNVSRERRRIRKNVRSVLSGNMDPESERQSWESWESHCLRLDAHRTLESTRAYRRRLLEDVGMI